MDELFCNGCSYYNESSHPSCSMWKYFKLYYMSVDVIKDWNSVKSEFNKYASENGHKCERIIDDVSDIEGKIKIGDHYVDSGLLERYIRVIRVLNSECSFFGPLDKKRLDIHNEIIKSVGFNKYTVSEHFRIQLQIWVKENL